MKIIDQLRLFVNIDDEIKSLSNEELKKCLDLKKFKINEFKMSPSEYLTLIILYRFSSHRYLKGFWYDFKNYRTKDFPHMPSYNVFVTWINRLQNLLTFILNKKLINLDGQLGIIDSTKLETTEPYRIGKVHKEATVGYSSLGKFRGFKLHLLINDQMEACSYVITPAKVHDLTVVKQGLLDGHTGKVLADSGYVSREVFYELQDENLYLIAKPRTNMMADNEAGIGYLPEWEITFGKIYKKRMKIERLFDYFKDKLNMTLNKLHSTKALYVHIISVLLANQLLRLNELTFVNI
jgi:hypothetical protein